MSAIVKAAIADELAKLVRVVATPTAPFGYGSDLSCTTDLTEQMSEVDPFSTRALAEAIVRRLDCPRGALPDDPNYGIDLRAACNRGHTKDSLLALGGQIEGELAKDDRIDVVRATVTTSSGGTALGVQISVTSNDPQVGDFTLTLAVTSAAILIEELSQ